MQSEFPGWDWFYEKEIERINPILYAEIQKIKNHHPFSPGQEIPDAVLIQLQKKIRGVMLNYIHSTRKRTTENKHREYLQMGLIDDRNLQK